MGSALGIPGVLRSLGFDPGEVLAELGIDLQLFDDAERRISLVARNRIVQHCATWTGCPHFGLLVGQQNGLHSFGLVGLLVKHSPDVGTALASFVRHQRLHMTGATLGLEVDGKFAALTWHLYEPGLEAVEHVGDGALASCYNIMRDLCGPDWSPAEVWFAQHRPADVEPFRQFFGVPLRFDAEQFALLFSAEILKRPLPVVDGQWRRLLQAQIDAIESRYEGEFAEQVRSVLRSSLLTGHAKADQVAALFGMHGRTMNRRLKAAGVHFQQLVDESRFAFAQQMLQDSAMDIGQISELLGYAAPSVFTRAFQRWSGATPAEWRTVRKHTKPDIALANANPAVQPVPVV